MGQILPLETTEIISLSDDTVRLATGLSSGAFGKIRMPNESGAVAVIADDGVVTFTPWSFTTTQVSDDDMVLQCGTFASPARTLSALFAAAGDTARPASAARALKATVAVCTALSAAIARCGMDGAASNYATDCPLRGTIGAGGIIVNDDCTCVLFLPAEHFERAVSNYGADVYTALQGSFVKKGLEGAAALAFTRAAVVYRVLAGKNAYAAQDAALRQTDMYDSNFLPLSLAVRDVAPAVASAVDAGLQMQADLRIVPGEKRALSKKQAAIRAQRATAMEQFVCAAVLAALTAQAKRLEAVGAAAEAAVVDGAMPATDATTTLRGDATSAVIADERAVPGVTHGSATVSPDEASFVQRRAEWQRRQRSVIARRRFLRRNRSLLIGMLIVGVGIAFVVISFWRDNRSLATSRGLSSRQTVETLYTGIQQSNVNVVRAVTHGKRLNNLLSIVSGVFVTAKQREGMAGQGTLTLTPAEWLFFKNERSFWLYGLTQFAVDGEDASTSFAYPTRRDKPAPLAEEDGAALSDGSTTQHTATYYRVHSDVPGKLVVEAMTDRITLTWRRNRWLVTDFDGTAEERTVALKELREAYAAALSATDGDIVQSLAHLRAQYDWLPTDAELTAAAYALVRRYGLAAARAYVEARQ